MPTTTPATLPDFQDNEVTRILLPPDSLLVLRDEARYHYAHRLPLGSTHSFRDQTIPRTARTSLVFWSSRPDPNAPPLARRAVETGRIRLA